MLSVLPACAGSQRSVARRAWTRASQATRATSQTRSCPLIVLATQDVRVVSDAGLLPCAARSRVQSRPLVVSRITPGQTIGAIDVAVARSLVANWLAFCRATAFPLPSQ